MEEVLFSMALVVSVGVLVMPIYAVVLGVTAKRRIRGLGDAVQRLKKSLVALEKKATSLATPSPQRESKAAAAATAGTTPAAQQPTETDEQVVPESDEPFRKTILTPVQPLAAIHDLWRYFNRTFQKCWYPGSADNRESSCASNYL